jgi:hypothetical protein
MVYPLPKNICNFSHFLLIITYWTGFGKSILFISTIGLKAELTKDVFASSHVICTMAGTADLTMRLLNITHGYDRQSKVCVLDKV